MHDPVILGPSEPLGIRLSGEGSLGCLCQTQRTEAAAADHRWEVVTTKWLSRYRKPLPLRGSCL